MTPMAMLSLVPRKPKYRLPKRFIMAAVEVDDLLRGLAAGVEDTILTRGHLGLL